jgi:hypothetical protein
MTAPGFSPSSTRPVPRGTPRILVVGGLARLVPFYREVGPASEVDCANEDAPLLARTLTTYDAIVVVPGHLSHRAARRVLLERRRGGKVVRLADGPGVHAVHRAIAAASAAVAA